MAAATSSTISQHQTLSIECSVCLDILNDPRVLPCQHSFCLSCLQHTWVNKQPTDMVHCPICREEFVIPEEGICGIRKDLRGYALIDVYSRATGNMSQFCDVHKDKVFDLYCWDCGKAVCSLCLNRNHFGHKVFKECEFLHETRKQMPKELKKLVQYERDMHKKKCSLEKYHNRFLKKIDETESVINVKAEAIKEPIEPQRMSLLEDLCMIKQLQLKEILKEKEEMENHSAEIESMKHVCHKIALAGDYAETFRAVTDFHTIRKNLDKSHLVLKEQGVTSVRFLFKTTTPGEVQSRANQIGSITSVSTRLIKKLDVGDACGLTKLRNSIYVLRKHSSYFIFVYEDQTPFDQQQQVRVREIRDVINVTSSERLKCLYVSDSVSNCIWKFTVDDRKVTKWLSDIGDPFTISVTSDEHILKLRDGKQHSQLEFYSSDASLVRILPLSPGIQWPLHAVEKPNGQFIIIHKANPGNGGPWFISELRNDGKGMSRKQFSKGAHFTNHPLHLSMDSEKDRLFLTSCTAYGVILLDFSSSVWNTICLTKESNSVCEKQSNHASSLVYYDTSKRQLLFKSKPYQQGKAGLSIVELS